jgi:hypothetical protein
METFQRLFTSFVLVFIPLMIVFYLLISFIKMDLNAFHWSVQNRGAYAIGCSLLSAFAAAFALETDLYKVFFNDKSEEG